MLAVFPPERGEHPVLSPSPGGQLVVSSSATSRPSPGKTNEDFSPAILDVSAHSPSPGEELDDSSSLLALREKVVEHTPTSLETKAASRSKKQEARQRQKAKNKQTLHDEQAALDQAVMEASAERARLDAAAPDVIRQVLLSGQCAPCGHRLMVAPAYLKEPSVTGDRMYCVECEGEEGPVAFACAGRCGFVSCRRCLVRCCRHLCNVG